MARGVDDVDLDVVPVNGRVLRQDGDSPLALERVGVHHTLLNDLVCAEDASLAEHLVDQRRLSVIDVRDDGNVANGHDIPAAPVRGEMLGCSALNINGIRPPRGFFQNTHVPLRKTVLPWSERSPKSARPRWNASWIVPKGGRYRYTKTT